MPAGEKMQWQGMRLTRDVRKDKAIPIDQKDDSNYRAITERPEQRKFNPLRVPRAIQRELPFAARPKVMKKRASNQPLYVHRRAVVMEADEKKIYTMMQQINTLRHVKEKKKKEIDAIKRADYDKKKQKEDEKRTAAEKGKKKDFYRKMGREQSRKRGADLSDAAFSSKRVKRE